jgi:RNA polymerase sigma-54 factor
MTPQLQQAIRLLQLSSLELQAEIQEALETNPLLEVEDDFDHDDHSAIQQESEKVIAQESQDISQLENASIPDELPTDSEWEDTFDTQPVSLLSGQVSDSGLERDNQDNSGDSLQEHLLWQMRLTPFSATEQEIAATIIDSIEDDGYLKITLEDIQSRR